MFRISRHLFAYLNSDNFFNPLRGLPRRVTIQFPNASQLSRTVEGKGFVQQFRLHVCIKKIPVHFQPRFCVVDKIFIIENFGIKYYTRYTLDKYAENVLKSMNESIIHPAKLLHYENSILTRNFAKQENADLKVHTMI